MNINRLIRIRKKYSGLPILSESSALLRFFFLSALLFTINTVVFTVASQPLKDLNSGWNRSSNLVDAPITGVVTGAIWSWNNSTQVFHTINNPPVAAH